MDGFTLATALMGLFPAVWEILKGLATSKFSNRLLNQQKKHSSSNQAIKSASDDDYNQLDDFIQELNSWIGLIDSNRNGVLDAFALDSNEVSDFIESVIRDLKSIKEDAQSILMRHNSSKKLISNSNSLELMEVLSLNQRTLKIIRRIFEFMFKELRKMGITEQNSNYNQYRLSARSNNPANVTNINIVNIFVGDCDKTSTERQLQMVAQMVNQIMKLNVNDTNTNNVPLQLCAKSRDHGSDLIGPSRFRRKPSFKQVSPVADDMNTEQDMRVYFNDEFSESRSESSNNLSLASISNSFLEEQKSRRSALQDDRTRGKTAIKSSLKLEGIDVKMCRMSHKLTLNGINCTSNKKLEHGTFLSYKLSYGGSDHQNGSTAIGSLMGDKNIFELGKIVSNAEHGKLAFYTECEVLETGTVFGLGLAVAGSSYQYKHLKEDKMVGWYKKSCGFDGRLGQFICGTTLEMDYCCGRAPGWLAGDRMPPFAEGERIGMGVRLSKDGSKGEVFCTRNGALLRDLHGDICWMDLRKLWKSDSWGSAPSSIREADIRLVVALKGPKSAVRLTFFENIPPIPVC